MPSTTTKLSKNFNAGVVCERVVRRLPRLPPVGRNRFRPPRLGNCHLSLSTKGCKVGGEKFSAFASKDTLEPARPFYNAARPQHVDSK